MNIDKVSLLVPIFLVFVGVALQDAHAQQIGQGYSCVENAIVKKGKPVKLSKAKKAVQAKIDALGTSNKDKQKKAALKEVKAALPMCQNGTLGLGLSGDNVIGVFSGQLLLVSRTPLTNPDDCLSINQLNTNFTAIRNGKKIRFGVADSEYTGAVTGQGFKVTLNTGNPEVFAILRTMTVVNITGQSADITLNIVMMRSGAKSCEEVFAGTYIQTPD